MKVLKQVSGASLVTSVVRDVALMLFRLASRSRRSTNDPPAFEASVCAPLSA